MVHLFFEHPYSKFLLALIMCIIIAFIDKVDIFSEMYIYYVMMIVLGLMIYSAKFDDYGFILLFICLYLLTYNNIVTNNKHDNT